MTFRTTSTIVAFLITLLACGYLFAGALMVGRWGIEPTESVLLFGRRIGVYFLGLAVLMFLARSIPASPARRAISSSAIVTCSGLAILGTTDFLAGRAATPILIAVTMEVVIAAAFARHLLLDLREREPA